MSDEIAYIVTRDSVKAEGEITEKGVALWHPGEDLNYDDKLGGYWVSNNGTLPAYEFTPEEFEEQYLMDAPEPEGKFMIFTPCHWQRVEER